jgi:hypothetical protein
MMNKIFNLIRSMISSILDPIPKLLGWIKDIF